MAARSLSVVLWKNLLLRKRHWFLTICEVLVPVTLFLLTAYSRSKINTLGKEIVDRPTYVDAKSLDLIYVQHINVETNVYYAPKTAFTNDLMRQVQLKLNLYNEGVIGFADESDLLARFTKAGRNATATMAVVFHGITGDGAPKNLSFDIRPYEKGIEWKTGQLFQDSLQYMPGVGSEIYIYKGIAALHLALDTTFVEKVSGKTIPDIMLQEFPYPPHFNDMGLTDMFMYVLPPVTIFSFVLLCPALLKRIVEEKVSGIKELMKMVGLPAWVLWLGWFFHAMFVNILSIIAIVILMKVSLWDAPYPPIEYCNFLIFGLFLILYCSASITFCFTISTIFNKPTLAMIFGIMAWVLSYFIPAAVLTSYENMRWILKILLCLFPNVALSLGYKAISVYEMREVGVNWSNLFQSASGGADDVTMGNVFVILIVDTVVYLVLTLYIDGVKPGPYGLAKPWHFPFSELRAKMVPNTVQTENESGAEQTPLNPKPGIVLRNVSKRYGNHQAVNSISLNILEGLITVLLGHNGAGKSTTMMMITGMIESSSGVIKIDGKDIRKKKREVQRNLGLCPQHNLLFNDLTALEHLIFFGKLKGLDRESARADAAKLLKEFGIDQKTDSFPDDLSGGMKRKLCLAIALIGKSKVLILDEPTSGMDPESRREVWDLLLSYRTSKTVLITTHFMEEADVLGDNVIIMDHGKVLCEGSPLTLKDKYGTGYHLSILFRHKQNEETAALITADVNKVIPDAKFKSLDGCNLTYILPIEKKSSFPALLELLEVKKDALGITNISMSITTMEDVFLKAGSTSSLQEENVKPRSRSSSISSNQSKKVETKNLFRALWRNRWYVLKKKWKTHIVQVITCLAIVFLTLYLGQGASDYYTKAELGMKLDLSVYGKTGVYYSNDSSLSKIADNYAKLAASQNGEPKQVVQVSDAILQQGVANIAYYKQHMIVAAEFNNSKSEGVVFNALYSNGALHGAAISVNLLMNAVLKGYAGDGYSISTKIAPLREINTDVSSLKEQSEVEVVLLWLIIFPIGLLFLVGGFIIFPQIESSSNVIKLEFMCGMRPIIYWATNLVLDYFAYFLVVVVIVIFIELYAALGLETFGGRTEIEALFRILLLYGLPAILYSYLFSFAKSASGAFASLLISGMFVGVILSVVVMVLEMSGDQRFEQYGQTIKYISLMFPQFGLTYLSVNFARKAVQNHNWDIIPRDKKASICRFHHNPCCDDENSAGCSAHRAYPWNWDEAGVMLASALGYGLVLCFIQWRFADKFDEWIKTKCYCLLFKNKNGVNGTGNVGSKTNRRSVDDRQPLLVAEGLEKQFGFKNIVVKGISFDVKERECFGLLGVNGAGKTTTFKMLTGDELLTNGRAEIINGNEKFNINGQHDEYLRMLGYCPQFDAVNAVLTGRQTLEIFSMIRGIELDKMQSLVQNLIDILDLNEVADIPCGKYSGGNKRKLSIAVALTGSPLLVLLDEPTSGVDPVGRRKLWNIITKLKNSSNNRKSFVLTSHSMEECEALCNRLAIMKDGKIVCEGTIPELKKDYSVGFTVKLKLKTEKNEENQNSELREVNVEPTDEPDCNKEKVSSLPRKAKTLHNAVKTIYKEHGVLRDNHAGLLHYHITDPEVSLGDLFARIESLKSEHPIIEDYSVSETTLEDVFLNVANMDSF